MGKQIRGLWRLVSLLLVGAALILSAVTVKAAQVTLAWDPPNLEPDIAGYKIYYGTASRDYGWVIDVGNATTFTVSDLSDGVSYYFTTTAYDTTNLESPYSNEVCSSDLPSPSGTIGTHVTVTDSGFGSKKGKVLVGNAATKIINWTDSSTTFEIRKTLAPGPYDIVVQSKEPGGVAQATYPGAFTMMAPEIISVDPSGLPLEEKTLSGNYFGSKKGKLFLGTRKCKVVSWTMDAATGKSQINFIVPKKLTSGTYDIMVVNKVGSATLAGGFTIN